MRGYILRRVGQNILTYFFFLTMVYVMIDAQPGDYSNIYLGDPRLTPAQREILRARLGLDKPVTERYVLWLKSFAQGDFGVSFSNYPRQVIDVIIERAPRTLVLFLTATVVAFYMGFLSGKVLAWRRGGFREYATTIGGVSLYTVFTPWFGLMMIWFFAYTLGWFPIGKFIDPIVWQDAPLSSVELFQRMLVTGMLSTIAVFAWLVVVQRMEPSRRRVAGWAGVAVVLAGILAYWLPSGVAKYAADILWHLILPIATLALISFAGTMLLTRNSMLETLREDYIMAARAKGLTEKSIRDKHAARNAMLPVVTSFVFSLAFALDGGVITETIFSWPGMGLTLLRAAVSEDIPMAIGALVFTGALALT
ncbi:MAG TPA: ABC transporter permease, partial [Anaerolineales bacterium]